jgi:hypothetical protein
VFKFDMESEHQVFRRLDELRALLSLSSRRHVIEFAIRQLWQAARSGRFSAGKMPPANHPPCTATIHSISEKDICWENPLCEKQGSIEFEFDRYSYGWRDQISIARSTSAARRRRWVVEGKLKDFSGQFPDAAKLNW